MTIVIPMFQYLYVLYENIRYNMKNYTQKEKITRVLFGTAFAVCAEKYTLKIKSA